MLGIYQCTKQIKITCPHKSNILVGWDNSSHEYDDRQVNCILGGDKINGEKLVKET